MAVTAALEEVRRRITSAGGDLGRITVVAVTKGFGAEAVQEAVAAGLRDLGENYGQELLAKASTASDVRWHFLGRVQRNKVKALAPVVHLWQAVDREAAGREIARHAPGAAVLVQVNISGEEQKAGCSPDETPALVDTLVGVGLDVRGLMGVGPAGPPEEARPAFRRLRDLADGLELPERSMGMSSDLEVAVEEGATIVRVGRALFGDRPERSLSAVPQG